MKEKDENEFEMPKWMECTWRRVRCGEDDCPICGRIKEDRQRHIEKGEDPDSMESVREDAGRNLEQALKMIKKDAEQKGFDITNIDDIEQPPPPEVFSLYEKVLEWRNSVVEILENADRENKAWMHTEAVADLGWYTNLLPAKVYRQLCNRWHIENGDDYGEFDFKYTKYVLTECLKITEQALKELITHHSGQKANLMLAHDKLINLKQDILEI